MVKKESILTENGVFMLDIPLYFKLFWQLWSFLDKNCSKKQVVYLFFIFISLLLKY